MSAQDVLTRLGRVPAQRTALVAGGEELTFGELRARVGGFADGLTARGIGREQVVAVSLPRGTDLVVALLGTLAAGAAYLPVDPALPTERRRYLIEDAGADLVVDAGTGEPVTGVAPRIVPAAMPADGDYAPVAVPGGTLAYVIYTSGSTGMPKGVEVTRQAVADLVVDLETVGVAGHEGARVGWNASASFDASVQQWTRVCRGDTLVMLDDATRADPAVLAAFLADTGITDLDLTPSHADPLLDHVSELVERGAALGRPLTVLIGGEKISTSLWRRITDLVDEGVLRAFNLYGPTEITVDAMVGAITSDTEPHIGDVLAGLRLRLLDDALDPVADGEIGEIYLGGPRVARGYRRRPVLTAQRFVADPVAADGTRMYRSGDLARRRADGTIEYLGRRDGQVKVHGHRVELGEIEAALVAVPGVAEAAVLYRDDGPTGPGLVGYYRAEAPVDVEQVTAAMADQLPGYMVPGAFVAVESFPRTVNGKLDRAALPAPSAPVAAPASAVTAPATPAQRLIAEVWGEVLGASGIGVEDNFFKLGGHSLLAIKLASAVRKRLGVALPVKGVYRNPRLGDLARFIESLQAEPAA